MTKQRLVVHLTNRVSVKGAWTTELAELTNLDHMQKVSDGLNAGVTLTLELPNGDFETFNTAHVVGVESQTWRESKHYGSGSAFDQGASLPANDDYDDDNYGQDED